MHFCIETLMKNKQERIVRRTMAFAIPITVIAFIMGHIIMPFAVDMTVITAYDVTALIVSTTGCFLYNWTDEDEDE